jgi:hypothetical protein
MIEELLALQDLDIGELVADMEECISLECPDGGYMCFEMVECVSGVMTQFNLLDISVTLTDALADLILNYCDCYKKLKDINPACYDYVSVSSLGHRFLYSPHTCSAFTSTLTVCYLFPLMNRSTVLLDSMCHWQR